MTCAVAMPFVCVMSSLLVRCFVVFVSVFFFFFSSRRRHTRYIGDWSSDVCSSDLPSPPPYCGACSTTPRRGFGRVPPSQAASGSGARRGLRSNTCWPIPRPDRRQIGRASCRERGESSAAAVSLKKKEADKTLIG